MGDSQNFYRLHEGVRRWIWQQNWTALRDIQEQAIAPILDANTDLVISASTASGKTEAAFLPACSRIAESSPSGIGILYISPLKALINDQYRRLQSLGEVLGIPVLRIALFKDFHPNLFKSLSHTASGAKPPLMQPGTSRSQNGRSPLSKKYSGEVSRCSS